MALLVGYGRKCITPEESVPLAGYGNTSKRMSTNILDDIYATCVAFTDGDDSTALLFTLDLLHANPQWTQAIREAITASCGIPGDKIMVANTHTHAAPDMYNREKECMPRYLRLLVARAEAAAREALADRKPAKLFAGVREMQQNMNFIRNYIKDPDAPGGLRHVDEPDRRLQLVKIEREGAQPIVLMNWQGHPCFTGGTTKTNVSADYIGVVRKYMEEKTGGLFAFFQGASGNVTTGSKIPGERITNDYATYGTLLGEWSMLLYEKLEPVPAEKVTVLKKTIQVPYDHSDDHMVETAKLVRSYWMENYEHTACTKFAMEHGLHSVYHASGILSRSRSPEFAEMELNVVSVGDVSFICAPFEMYNSCACYIKDNSPFAMTFLVTSCNTLHGYLAEDRMFDIGCYEVDFRRYCRGTAEKVAQEFVFMLRDLKQENQAR